MHKIGKHLAEVSEAMTLLDVEEVQNVVNALQIVKRGGGTVYVVGNGGSHATATHFVNDLIKMAGVRAVCIGDMATAMLAYGNDNGWDNMFSDPLSKLIKRGDAVVGITCSGNSVNVLNALQCGMDEGMIAIALTGPSLESKLSGMDLHGVVHAVSEDIRVQEDIHLMVCHGIVRSIQDSY